MGWFPFRLTVQPYIVRARRSRRAQERPSSANRAWGEALIATVILLTLSCYSGGGQAKDPCEAVECPEGERCVHGTCEPDDGTSDDGSSDEGVSDEDLAECSDDVDCAEDWICDEGTCAPGTPVDPCESITCAEGEQCVDGACVVDEQAPPCLTDADCPEGEACTDGQCVEPESDLGSENPDLDFENLFVGETYELVAPAPADLAENVAPDAEAESDGGTDSSPDFDSETPADGGQPAGRPAPSECSCAWTATPATAVAFGPLNSCTTEMTPAEAGSFTLAVTVTCETAEAEFTIPATASIPPTPCTVNDDCSGDEICTESICVTRTSPLMTVLTERTRTPFVIAYDLRLEDRQGDPIHEDVTLDQFRIFENEQEIDYAEIGWSVTPAPNLPLKIVLVLDHTLSMSDAGAIGPMVTAAREFVQADHFTATHFIGVVEFHNRTAEGEGYSIAAPLTRADPDGKANLAQLIPAEGTLEPGLSRVWDAVDLAINMLGEVERQPGERHAIVFLTDAMDTTSETTPDDILSAAVANDIVLYPIGFGDVSDNTALLQSFADETRGAYFPADNAEALTQVFADLALDLRGQWTLSYVTQHNSGTVSVQVEFDWQGETDSIESEVNVGALDGDVHASVFEVLERSYDETVDRTSFLLKAAYVARNISRFRFFVAQSDSTLSLQTTGALTPPNAGWAVLATDGMYDLIGTVPVAYGAFGNIGVVSVPGELAQLQVTHDDSIYRTLPQPKTVTFEGDARLAPAMLTVAAEPVGGGVISITPNRFAYEQDDTVSLIASANGDHVFDRWEGGVTEESFMTSVIMEGDQTITALYFPPHTLTVVVEPVGAGTVTVDPSRSSYRHGDVVGLTATPIGSTFSGWSGGASGTDPSTSITMDTDKTVTATFTVEP